MRTIFVGLTIGLLAWSSRTVVYVYRCTTTGEVKYLERQMPAGSSCDNGRGHWIFLRTETTETP